ncbi:MAG: helix-turn-helix domain-containing protein [Clostridiales bacterium]|nr:helix-turn-helix domain-containing protein [Clostridiales bacterium]
MFTNKELKPQTKIDKLLLDFNTLTNMKICIYNTNGEEIGFYPERFCAFCDLARKDKSFDDKCKKCDQQAVLRCRTERSAQIYTCHAGLAECVVPIIVGETIRGFIAFGQVRQSGNEGGFFIDPSWSDNLKEEYKKLPEFSPSIIQAAAHVLEACASYGQLKKFASSLDSTLQTRIEEYVKLHLTEKLGVERLCRHFHCSRKELYSIIKQYYGMTPADYIKQVRLKYACNLLLTTKNSVSKIAELCGIYDYNYFSKIFKKQFNMSPRQFRNK